MEAQGRDTYPIYKKAAEIIKNTILHGQYEAAKGVNRVQLATYFSIGKYVSINTRQGVWGSGALGTICEHLQKLLPGLRGYNISQLKNMRLFYEAWTILDSNPTIIQTSKQPFAIENSMVCNSPIANGELQTSDNKNDIFNEIHIPDIRQFPAEDFFRVPFTHHCRILEKTKNLDERYYYLHRCAEEHLSVNQIKQALKSDDYHNQERLPNNFKATISKSALARKAVMAFKDEYLLNFINIEEIGERDREDIDERVIEQQIIHNIKKFIMTFGNDFAFIGNQYRMEIYGVEHFPDLVFFNRELNALVIIELKTGEFKSAYLGQLMSYLTIADDHLRKPHENPSIGIVLCRSTNKNYAQYMVRQYGKPMGVATYQTSADMPEKLRNALPDIEELKKIL